MLFLGKMQAFLMNFEMFRFKIFDFQRLFYFFKSAILINHPYLSCPHSIS